MDAMISGEAGVALLIDGASFRSLHLGVAPGPIHRRRDELPFLFGDARDLQVLESVPLDEAARRLQEAAARIDGLHLILILLDADLAADTRQEAAVEVEELLAQTARRKQLRAFSTSSRCRPAPILPARSWPARAARPGPRSWSPASR